jgi:hypothetical protein
MKLVQRCDSVALVQRWDTATLPGKSYETTPQGGIRARGRISRSGVLEYDLPDGSKRREWIPPEELFKPESYKTLFDAPIVVHHPDGGEVNASTYQRLTVGHVSNDVAPEGNEFLAGTEVIQDEDTVRLALGGSLIEQSAGYLCALDMTPGVVPDGYPDAGQPYDCIQRNRKYNHVALLPPGMGRAGPSVSLRLDSKGNQLGPTQEKKMELTPEELAALRGLLALAPKLQALLAAPAPAPAAPPAAPTVDTAPAPAPPAPTPAPEEKKKDELPNPEEKKTDSKKEPTAVKALTPEDQERIVNDSIELRDQARKVLGDQYEFKGKSNKQVMVDVVKHVDSKFDLGSRSEDYLRGRFESALEQAPMIESLQHSQHSLLRDPAQRADSKDGAQGFEDDNDFLMSRISKAG